MHRLIVRVNGARALRILQGNARQTNIGTWTHRINFRGQLKIFLRSFEMMKFIKRFAHAFQNARVLLRSRQSPRHPKISFRTQQIRFAPFR